METLPQNIYLNILAQVVESVSHELSINDNMKEQDVIMTLSGALRRCFESIHYISFFQNPITNKPIDIDVRGGKRKWQPDILVRTSDGVGFFVELKIIDSDHYSARDYALRLYALLNLLASENIVGGLLVCLNRKTNQIRVEQIIKGDDLKEVSIFEQELDNGKGKVAILIASQYTSNPEELLDRAAVQYVGDKRYNQFVDIRKDSRLVRVITTGINDLSYEAFGKQQL